MNSLGMLTSVSKFLELGGSNGKFGCDDPQRLRPFRTAHSCQNVHRELAGAPGIFDVSA